LAQPRTTNEASASGATAGVASGIDRLNHPSRRRYAGCTQPLPGAAFFLPIPGALYLSGMRSLEKDIHAAICDYLTPKRVFFSRINPTPVYNAAHGRPVPKDALKGMSDAIVVTTSSAPSGSCGKALRAT
jgi:hypothetical protein